MNLKDFKVQSEADDSYHLEHPSGKTFTVDKAGLSPKALKHIKKLSHGGAVQMLNSDGTVEDEEESSERNEPLPTALPPPASGVEYAKNLDANVVSRNNMADLASRASNPAQLMANPTGNLATAPALVPQSIDDNEAAIPGTQPQPGSPAIEKAQDGGLGLNDILSSGVNQQGQQDLLNSAKAYSKAIGASGAASAQASGDYLKQIQGMESPTDMWNRFNDEDAQLKQNVLDAKVDPRRYMANMDTAHHIGTAISLILGGIGGGSSGRNVGLDMLNKAIDRDTEAQRNTQSNAMNLYQMNRRAHGDEMQANMATQNQMYSMAQAKIAQAAAQSNNAGAQLNAQNTIYGLQQQINHNNMIKAIYQSGASKGMPSNIDPAMAINTLVQEPAQRAAALKEVDEAQKAENFRSVLQNTFHTLADMKLGGKLSPEARKAALAVPAALMNRAFGVRQAQAESTIEAIMPGGGWTGIESQNAENIKFKNLMSLADSYRPSGTNMPVGLSLNSFAKTATPIQRLPPALQRQANAAMNDPGLEGAKFLQKYGIR